MTDLHDGINYFKYHYSYGSYAV